MLDVSSPNPDMSISVFPRSATLRGYNQNSSVSSLPLQSTDSPQTQESPQQVAINVDRIRTLILGMEERLSKRESQLESEVARAQAEAKKFEELSRKLPT